MQDNQLTLQLQSLAKQIEEWRNAQNLSKAELIRRYPDLGSDRTYNRCLSGDTADSLDEGEHILKYTTVLHLLELDDETSLAELPVIAGLSTMVRVRGTFQRLAREKGNRRFLPIFGNSGMGKTTAIRWLVDYYGAERILVVEAGPSWRSKGKGTDRALLRAICRALGQTSPPTRGDDLLAVVTDLLNRRRRAVVVEEAHELCLDGLMMLKNLINLTQGEFVVTAHPRLWDNLSKAAYSTCSQLMGNRLFERVNLQMTEEDVKLFLDNRLPAGLPDEPLRAGSPLSDLCRTFVTEGAGSGNWSYVSAVCERVTRAMADRRLSAPTLALVSEQCKRENNVRDGKLQLRN